MRQTASSGTFEEMRALPCLALAALAACGPKVAPKASAFDEELPTEGIEANAEPASEAPPQPRPEAPPGKGLRTGTIERAKLIAVLDKGPGAFLRQLEVTPHMDGNRFIGWQLVQLVDRNGPLVGVDVAPGDVLLAVNGRPVARPEQLQAVWDSLRTANELRAQLWRGDAKLELAFAIEPKVDPNAPPPAPAKSPASPAKPAPADKPEPPAPAAPTAKPDAGKTKLK